MQCSLRVLFLSTSIILFLTSLDCEKAVAQHAQGGRHKTDSVPPAPKLIPPDPLPDSVIERRLVELACTGPTYMVADQQIKISKNQLSKAKKTWLNLLSLSTNYNDQTFAKSSPNGPSTYVYPKYFFGLTIPLGLIFSTGAEIRMAKEGVEISKDNAEIARRSLKALVLSKYKEYKNYGQLIFFQSNVTKALEETYESTQKKFSNSTATMDQYNLAIKNFGDEKVKLLNLQLVQDQAKLEIEKLIGVDLDKVINER